MLVLYHNADKKHKPMRPLIEPAVQFFGWLAPLHLPTKAEWWLVSGVPENLALPQI